MAPHNRKPCECGHRKGEHYLVERQAKGPCSHSEEVEGDVFLCSCTKYRAAADG